MREASRLSPRGALICPPRQQKRNDPQRPLLPKTPPSGWGGQAGRGGPRWEETRKMNAEFFEALALLEKERGLSAEYLIGKIKEAIVHAVKKDRGLSDSDDEYVLVEIDPDKGAFNVSLAQDIVEEVEMIGDRPRPTQVDLATARQKRSTAEIGERLLTPLETRDFGRIAAQTAKHVIRQGVREAERNQMYSEMQSKAHEIISGTVTRIDPVRHLLTIDLGKSGEAVLPHSEQVEGEEYYEGQHLQVYVVDVTVSERGPRIMISRTHPGLVKRMFEMEVPEIFDGTVEVKAIAREAGARTKMAVWSKDENVDAQGACIGAHGARVARIVEELGGEKIDIVKWSEDPAEFISAALSPARVLKVELLEGDTRSCKVTVPDQQLSLAIGNKGQNARLCARLTGYNIDIRPESGYYGEE